MVYFNQNGSWRTGGFNGTAPGVGNAATCTTTPGGVDLANIPQGAPVKSPAPPPPPASAPQN